MQTVELMHEWQGGPASIEVEGDQLADPDVYGVILRISTAADLGAGDTFSLELGAGRAVIEMPEHVKPQLEFSVAAKEAQARELAHAILREIGDE